MTASDRLSEKWRASPTTTTPAFPSSTRRLGGCETNGILSHLGHDALGLETVPRERLCARERVTRKLKRLLRMRPASHREPLNALEPDGACSEPAFRSTTGLGGRWQLGGGVGPHRPPAQLQVPQRYLSLHSNSVSRMGLLSPPSYH